MKIAMYDLEGHLLEVFDCEFAVDLEAKLKLPISVISSCLNGYSNSTNGLQFRRVSSNVLTRIGDITKAKKGGDKPIAKYYKGKYIQSYKNAVVAEEKTQVPKLSIQQCASGHNESSYGFEWKYIK